MMLAELLDGGLFLQPAEALPVRDIPLETMKEYIVEDEWDAEGFWKRIGKKV